MTEDVKPEAPLGNPTEAHGTAETVAPTDSGSLLKDETPAASKLAAAELAAPPEYQPFTLPEGMTLDAEMATSLTNLAKDCRLTQAQAQQFADLGGQLAHQWANQLQQAQQATSADWRNAAEQDNEYGGAKFQENLSVANRALARFGTPPLMQFLEASGLGNHPELIRLLYRTGKAISVDTPVGSDAGSGSPRFIGEEEVARQLYPHQSP